MVNGGNRLAEGVVVREGGRGRVREGEKKGGKG